MSHWPIVLVSNSHFSLSLCIGVMSFIQFYHLKCSRPQRWSPMVAGLLVFMPCVVTYMLSGMVCVTAGVQQKSCASFES